MPRPQKKTKVLCRASKETWFANRKKSRNPKACFNEARNAKPAEQKKLQQVSLQVQEAGNVVLMEMNGYVNAGPTVLREGAANNFQAFGRTSPTITTSYANQARSGRRDPT